MRLKISGIGKIGDSEIELKGITVIAGENNTGKSTFGKVL
jgi:AAA15 family ATPase/GTPase